MKSITASTMAIGLALAASASAQPVTVRNPLDMARPDAVVEVAVKAAKTKAHKTKAHKTKAWSVRIGKTVLPAQYMPATGRLRFVTSLKAHEAFVAEVLPVAAPPAPRRVQVTLNIQDGGKLEGTPATGGAIKGGTFHLRDHYTVPKDHFIHDGLIAFEGIGWESDRVAYRLYLDERNVPDIFGKFGPGMIFQDVGHGFDDYQYPRAWGGDIFKVGQSLGMGGVGLLREGKATQIGPATVTGRVVANGPVTAIAGVDADALGGTGASIHATYAISAGSAVTEVDVRADGVEQPLLTGVTVHAGDETIQSAPDAGAWDYIAVWGAQEHDKDQVGTAVFYRRDSVTGAPVMDGNTLFVRFASKAEAHYAFAARWVQEGKNIAGYEPVRDLAAFKAWLETERTLRNHPVTVSPGK